MSGEVVGQLQQVLTGLSSPDNKVREQAEAVFEENWVPHVNVLIPTICGILSMEGDATIRSFAAVLLRRSVRRFIQAPEGSNKKGSQGWRLLDGASQSQCCEMLLNAWQKEGRKDVRNKISDAIAEIAQMISTHEEWPQLLAMLWAVDASGPEFVSVSALRILASVPESVSNQKGEVIASYLAPFFTAPGSTLAVRVEALKAAHSIISNSADDKKMSFSGIISLIPDFLAGVASQDVDLLIETLQCVVEMTDECPKLFRNLLSRLIPILVGIVDSVGEDECKSVALELITSLVEALPGTVKKNREIISTIVTLQLKTISGYVDREESTKEWYEANPDDEIEEEVLSLTAEASLDRTCIALGGKALLPTLMATIPGMCRSQDWRHRYGALRAIANMAEGCGDILADKLEDLLSLVWPSFSDVHPRVQYSACHALGQLCSDFSGPLQEHFPQQCLTSLATVLLSSQQPRVQCHAAAALINFAEGVDSAVIAPVLDGLLERLVALLGASQISYLQEQILATMAAFSTAAGVSFTKYLPQVIPLLNQCLSSSNASGDKSFRMLQCRALEASTMVAMAVGRDNFASYTKTLLDMMLVLQQQNPDADDPMWDCLPSAWVRMCQVLGRDFAPFIPLILPLLLQDAAAEPDIAVLEAAEEEEEYDQSQWEFATIKGRRMGIHTATLDSKCAAVENLAVYISTLQADFAPYVQQTFNTLLPLIHFNMHEGVQIASTEALATLIKVLSEASINNNNNVESLEMAKTMSHHCCSAILVELEKDCDAELATALLDSLADIINIANSSKSNAILPEDLMASAFNQINALLTILLRNQKNQGASHDDEDEDYCTDDDDENVMYAITRLSAALFQTYKAASLPHAQTLLQFCVTCINQGKPSLFRHAALCILDDLVHYIGDGTQPIQQYVCQSFAFGLADEDADVRQASVFGIGMCSENASALYESFCLETLPGLIKMIEHKNCKAPSVITVTDNAMSAVARICKAYPGKVDLKSILPSWIQGLPVTHDEAESGTVYTWLLSLLADPSTASLLITNTTQGAFILRALLEPLIKETLTNDDLKAQVRSAAVNLQMQLPADAVQSAVSTFSPEQLAKLQ